MEAIPWRFESSHPHSNFLKQVVESPSPRHDPYSALREKGFRHFLLGHVASVLGIQMQTVAVAWQLYEKTGSAMALGLVGLVQVIPMLGLALPAGHAADKFDRRRLLMAASVLAVVSSLGLLFATLYGSAVSIIYVCLAASGIARAYQGPARSALMPALVPRSSFSNAVTWGVSGFELASMAGPALGGLFIAMFKGTWQVYLFAALTSTIYVFMLASIRQRSSTASVSADGVAKELDLRSLVAGFGYVRRNTVLLAAMTLDLFAVLLGGAVALLPIFAKDILRVGPVGLGWLQAAPSLGAILMALTTTHLPPMKKAGKTLLWAVAGFGIATVVFGISRSFWLSLLMLFLTGAFDNISVVVRHTLVQVLTPDEMRGRVSAVNGMFINASNELGRFESGVLAAFTGPIAAVVIGGAGTLAVVAFSALKWPELRRVGMLDSDTVVK